VRSLGDVRVSVANAFTNLGSVIAHRDLAISAGRLSNNRGQLLAGRDGDIRVTGQLLNDAGIIESGRDLTLTTGSFVNRRGPLTTSHINYGDAAPSNAVNCRHEHGFCEATAQIESTGPAQLNAARKLTLSTQSFLNDASLVSAGSDLDIEAQSAATNATRLLTTSWHGHWREWRGVLRGYKNHDEFGQSVTGQTPAVIQAGGQITLHAPTLTNSGNIQANSVYLGGNAITNGITDFSHQTPGSTLPDSGISLANSALFGSSGFSGKLGDSLLFTPQASPDTGQFVYSGPPAPPNLISLTQEDLLNALPEHLRPGGSTPPKFLFDPQQNRQRCDKPRSSRPGALTSSTAWRTTISWAIRSTLSNAKCSTPTPRSSRAPTTSRSEERSRPSRSPGSRNLFCGTSISRSPTPAATRSTPTCRRCICRRSRKAGSPISPGA
jgi:adhesin HecA-like repeat protein